MSVNVVDNNVTVTASQEVEVANEVVTNTIVNEYPNTISVKSNEFAVVGDGLFATTKEEVPGWMRELVGDLARNATIGAYNAMTGFNYNLYNAMTALRVAENTYQQVINTRITDQEAFVQAVETLNSTVQNSEAEIVGIKQTYATKDFAIATAATTLEASLNGGTIKSSLGQLASTMTNQYGTMAQRMDVLESTFDDLGSGVEGYANATSELETFVGKNAPGTNAPVIASSKFYQDLNVYLAGTDYTTGGTNTLVNQVTAAATGVESKFAYNSSLKLNGATYDSGFGLATSLTPGSGIPVGSSEFWINADKFKLTTTGYNGVKYSPFSVNGTDGTITFNGKVNFNSVTNVPNFVLPEEVADAINTNTTTIDGAKITTGTIQAGAIAAGAITADKLAANSITANSIAAGAVGSINIASTLQSDNYIAGTSGWRLSKVANVLSEFNSNVAFRGSVDVNNLTGAVLKPHIVGEQVISTYGEPSYLYNFNHPTAGISGRRMVVIVLATATSEWYSYDGVYNQGVRITLFVNETYAGTGIDMGAYNTTATAIGVSMPVPVGNFSVRISLGNAEHDSLKRSFTLAALSYLV